MGKADNILKQIAKDIPTGTHHYVATAKKTRYGGPTVLAGPYDLSKCKEIRKSLQDKEAYIATWDGKKWEKVK